MINLKTMLNKNNRIFTNSCTYFVWCIIALFLTFSFTFNGFCTTGKSTISLPTSQDGIEKIEYMINGVAQGSTDGIGQIEVQNGSSLSFAIKFSSEGYNKLYVRDVEIQSENGSILRLNTYSKNDDGSFVLMRVSDDETIDPKQTYVSSSYIVSSDDSFTINGVTEDTYSAIIRDENNDVNLFDAVDLKYSQDGNSYIDAPFSELENAFVINNIKNSSNIKLMINVKDGYTDSDLSLVCDNLSLAISSESKICSLPEFDNDLDVSIRNLQKKSYTVTFNEYTNTKFDYKISGQDDFSESPTEFTAYHGDTIEFTCTPETQDILDNNEVTVNGIVITPSNGVYKIENINSDCVIATTPKNSALYPISIQNNEKRLKLSDLSGNEVPYLTVNQNASADFKIIPTDAYSKYFITTQIYAVPASKISDGSYDISANPDEANSFLIIPNSENVYSLQNVTEPIVLIPSDMQATTCTVTIPDKIIGARATVLTNDDVQQISDTKFSVTYGSDFTVNLEAEPGYDISDMIIGDMDDSIQVVKNGDSYTYKNIDGNKYLIINGASAAYCNVHFDSKNLVISDIYGTEWENNSSTIKYQEGTIKFRVNLNESQTNHEVGLVISSGDGNLELISPENNVYSLSNVTQDTVLSVGNATSPDVTVTLNSDNDDIIFTDIYDENIIIPMESTLKLGQDFTFKVVSKSGKSVDNLKLISSASNPITEISSISNAYTLTALNSDTISIQEIAPTTNNAYSQSSSNSDTSSEPSIPRMLKSMLRTVSPSLRNSPSNTETDDDNDQYIENIDVNSYNKLSLGAANISTKCAGLTLANNYIFPQAQNLQQNKTSDVLPQVTFQKKPKYVVFSNDKNAKDCINKKLIAFDNDTDTTTFQINKDRDKNTLTLPPLFYRYRMETRNQYWYNDAYSPGDSYYDPARPYNPETGEDFPYPGGKFSLKLKRTQNDDDTYTLSFDEYKISSTRTNYGGEDYDRSYTITGSNNNIIANVPKLIFNNNFGSDAYNPDDLDYLFTFTTEDIYNYGTPYSPHNSNKFITNGQLTVTGPAWDYANNRPYTDAEHQQQLKANTPLNLPTLLYRLPTAYCHVFDEIYSDIKLDRSLLEPYQNVEITGDDVTQNPDDSTPTIHLPDSSDTMERIEKTFNVYLPENTVIKPVGDNYLQPFEFDNSYNEISSQQLNYDTTKQCSYVTITANMSRFEEKINLKWKDDVKIINVRSTATLDTSDIIRYMSTSDYSTVIKLNFTGTNQPTVSEDNPNLYTLNSTPFSYDNDPNATVTFNVQLPTYYAVNPNQDSPLFLDSDSGHSSILSQELSSDRNIIICKLRVSGYDDKLYLKWKNFSEDVVNTTQKIKMQSEHTVFRDSRETPINSENVSVNAGFVFYTEPREGCSASETIVIDTHRSGTYQLDDILKLKYKGTDGQEHTYNNEWIKLSPRNSLDKNSILFIRASKSGSMIKYEIASERNISGYIKTIDDTEISNTNDDSEKLKYEFVDGESSTSGIISDLTISSFREIRSLSVIFTDTLGIVYHNNNNNEPMETNAPTKVSYGDTIAFKVSAEPGYDISNLQITSSTATKTNVIPLTNGVYVVANITENTTISAKDIQKSLVDLSFNQSDGASYLNSSGDPYDIRQYVPYQEDIVFQVSVDPGYTSQEMNVTAQINGETKSFATSPSEDSPYINNNFYIIPAKLVTDSIKVSIDGLKRNEYKVLLKTPEPTDSVSYYDQYNVKKLEPNNGNDILTSVKYGESFRFQVQAQSGFDTSQMEVVAKSSSGNAITLISANGVYTIENITDDYTVTISGVKHENHTVEFRTGTGVAYLDEFGNSLPSSVSVADGDTISFYLSFDDAYSKSRSSANVVIKGSNNTIPHDDNGKYTLGGNTGITKNQIVEVTNVTKNSYTATFVPAEGVIYKTAKGKEFSGTLDLEYGESLYFKISLMDAYDQSIPYVKLNGNKNLVENSGSYVIENVNDDVVITVENVEKNPEEVTIDNVNNVPETIINEQDVNSVVLATRAYESLSDDEKKLVTNKQTLEKAQSEAGDINHSSGDVTISGLDWYIKLIATPLTDDKEQMTAFAEKVDRRTLLSLYKIELINLLTEEEYSIPYGSEVQITLPSPDLTGYKNTTVAHENLVGNMEYIDPNIVDETAKFTATTTGLFGIAAKAIPNYSENVSDLSISMGDLTENDEELQSVLGDELSSQLGHLIDLEDDLGNSDNNSNTSSQNNDDSSSDDTQQENNSSEDSILNSMTKKATDLSKKAYNWALDNEFTAVIIILVAGFGLIAIILASNRKKDKNNSNQK